MTFKPHLEFVFHKVKTWNTFISFYCIAKYSNKIKQNNNNNYKNIHTYERQY